MECVQGASVLNPGNRKSKKKSVPNSKFLKSSMRGEDL